MADPVSALKARLLLAEPDLHLELSAEFGSLTSDHRLKLRQSLYEHVKDPAVLNLEITPCLMKGFVSISHCPSLGGFALSDSPIGFDIEITDRVQPRIVERMAHPDDGPAPTSAAIWAAKEATFKSLGKNQPAIISEISVHSWETIDSNSFRFSTPHGNGLVTLHTPWTVAIFRPVSI